MDRIKKYLLITLGLTLTIHLNAQTDKQIDKSIKLFEKDISKGIAKLEKYMDKNHNFPSFRAWETLIKMKHQDYERMNSLYSSIMITVADPESGEAQSEDSLADALKQVMFDTNKEIFIDACRRATIMSVSPTADTYLRRMLIDFEPDSLVSDKAREYFDEGETFFRKNDFELAELNYSKAIKEEPEYYKAVLALGDAFWANEQHDSAIVYFNRAIELQPNLLEPRKYLIDALLDKELYVRAKQECINAMCVYPSNSIKFRFQHTLKQENKYMNEHKIKRDFYANNMMEDEQDDLIKPYDNYRNAKKEISKFCNKDGIIEPNSKTNEVYLEVYSWRRFIEENEDNLPERFRFAQKMMKAGYLDCYVLLSFFHVDIYGQLQHFMAIPENRERIETYINTYLIESYK